MNDKAKKVELRAINYSYNHALSKLRFSKKEDRIKKVLLSYFGIASEDTTPLGNIEEECKQLKNELTRKVELKYEERKVERGTASGAIGYTGTTDRDTRTEDSDSTEGTVSFDVQQEDINTESTFVPKYPDQTATFIDPKICKQEKAARQLWDNFTIKDFVGQLLLAQTGSGKTFILGSFIKNFIEQGFVNQLNVGPWPILYVTKASVVRQTEAVLKEKFGIDIVNTVHVVNIEMLRSYLGSLFVKEEVVIINGVEHVLYKWNDFMVPCLIIWDECQILAREESIQSKIAQDVNRVQDRCGRKIIQIFASATPFARVAEARCFSVSTRCTFNLGGGDVVLTDEKWKVFSDIIAAPADPYEYCEAAVKRLIEHLEPYVTRIKGIRPKFKAYNSVQRIYFKTKEEAQEYQEAWDKYQEEKARIESDYSMSEGESRFALLAQLTIFAQAAEYIRRYHIVDFIVKSWERGFAPVIAVRFKQTQTAVYKILVTEHGWKRDDISMIWGGSTQSLSKKKKLAKKIAANPILQQMMEAMGVEEEDLKSIGIDIKNLKEKTDEELAFEKEHGLLTQKPEEREIERLKFQSQKSRCCIFNFKSGGVGLSLHHEPDFPNARPRTVLLTPVYSEKELIQGLGRCPRITSCSDTTQVMVYYHNTIEADVAMRVAMKLKCARVVTGKGESWESIITGRDTTIVETHTEIMDAVDEFESNELMEYKEEAIEV